MPLVRFTLHAPVEQRRHKHVSPLLSGYLLRLFPLTRAGISSEGLTELLGSLFGQPGTNDTLNYVFGPSQTLFKPKEKKKGQNMSR